MKYLTGPFIFWVLAMIAGVFNWFFNLLAGRTLPKEDFAVLSVFTSFVYLLGVPANALSITVSRFTAYYRQKGADKFYFFFRQYWWFSWAVGSFFFFLFFLLKGFLAGFFSLKSPEIFLLFIPFSLFVFLLAFEFGLLLGQMAFVWVGFLLAVEAAAKFVLLFFCRSLNFPFLSSAVFSLSTSAFLAWFAAILIGRSFRPISLKTEESFSEIKETFSFLSSSFFTSLGTVLVCSLDVLLVNHFLPSSEAGIYATLSFLGKIIYFGAGGLTTLLVPITARDQAKDEKGRKPLWLILGAVFLFGGVLVLLYLFFTSWTVVRILTEKGLVVQPYLAKYCLAIYFLTFSTCFITHSLARKNYFQANLITAAAIIEAVLIILFHHSISEVVEVVFWTMLGLLLTVLISEFTGFTLRALVNNLLSLFKLFSNGSGSGFAREKPKILFFNWRDLQHELAGGAEVYLYEIAKRLAQKGLSITIFTANDGKNKPEEIIDGVEIIRRGGFLTVYFWAAAYYFFRLRNKFDLVVDCENGLPFYSPLYVRKPVVLLVYHVHRDIFLKSLLPPFSWLAVFLETKLMPFVYRKSKIISVSRSTAEDLEREVGIKADSIIFSGVDLNFYLPGKKSPTPLVCYLGRLKAYKSLEVLIDAFAKLIKEFPKAKLVIAGEGDRRKFLKDYVERKALGSFVEFTGKVTEEEKIKLLSKSWVVVNPSYKEGWGIVCLEANACGTPVLASKVEGLKEVVSEGESGYLFDYGNTGELYRQIKELIGNPKERKKLSKSARKWSINFGWEEQAERFTNFVFETLNYYASKEKKWLKQASPSESRL